MDGIKKQVSTRFIHTHMWENIIRTGIIVWLLFLESLRLFFSNCRRAHKTLEESERHPHKNKIADSVSSSALKAIFCRTSSSSSGKKYY
jgi:hypothetical protein